MKIRRIFLPGMISLFATIGFSSCLSNNDEGNDYTEWKEQNETFIAQKEAETGANGEKLFQKIIPDWCPGVYILAQWHNDRSLTAGNLVPMDNSTVDVIYDCEYINGTVLDSSAAHYADSVFRCKPNSTIVGFWSMLTNMHVGDSVTCIIPMAAGYGASSTSVKPYSTLIYHIKLKGIHAYELPSN